MFVVNAIYEAKRTISPSTLFDILTKKLGAVELLLRDTTAELAYNDGVTSKKIPLFSPGMEHSNSSNIFTFGIYGIELLHPKNAADSIRSVAGANVVSSNLIEVINAIERCIENSNELLLVEVETSRTLYIVKNLKELINEKMQNQDQIQILLCIHEDASFLHAISQP
jgi:hypothetical protein